MHFTISDDSFNVFIDFIYLLCIHERDVVPW